jgi:hypothetical protein
MKKLLLLTVSVALFRVAGFAAPCTTGTLATYIAMASSGCVLGDVLVANFTYHAKADGGAALITADQITVTPLLAPTGTFGLQFSAPWSVEALQQQQSSISYNSASSTASVQVQQARLDGNGFQAGTLGRVVVNEALATPATTSDLQVFLTCTEACRSRTSAMVTFTPGASALTISNNVTLQSKGGAASVISFTNWLVVCIPCV